MARPFYELHDGDMHVRDDEGFDFAGHGAGRRMGATMALANHLTPAPSNRPLAALPPEDLARLWPRLEAVQLPLRKALHAPGEPITAPTPATSPCWPTWRTAARSRSGSSAAGP